MALIFCSNCGKQISDKAVMCPKCGYKPNESSFLIEENETVIDSINNDIQKKYSNPQCKRGFIFGLLSMLFYEFWAIIPIIALTYSIKGLKNFDDTIHKNKWQGTVGAILGGLYIFAYLTKIFELR